MSKAHYLEYDAMTLDQLRSEKRSIGLQVNALGQQMKALRLRADHLKFRIRALADGDDNPSIRISDHAVIRYLERVKGLDIVSVRKEIRERAHRLKIEPTVHDQLQTDGGLTFAIYDGDSIATIWTETPRNG